MATYGILTTDDLENNRDKVKADWNPDTDIEHLWTRATTCKKFAEGTALALSDEAIMHLLLVPLEKTKVLQDDIKAWRILPTNAQTWDNFKEHFEARNKERTRNLSTGTAGYNALSAVTAKLTIDDHSANFTVGGTGAPPTPKSTPGAVSVMNAGPGSVKMYYCHSCGLTPYKNHTSITCNKPKPGHKIEATFKNMMNGSTTFMMYRARTNTGPRTGSTAEPLG